MPVAGSLGADHVRDQMRDERLVGREAVRPDRQGESLDGRARRLERLDRAVEAGRDGRLALDAGDALLDDADPHAADAGAVRRRVALGLDRAPDPLRIAPVVAGDDLEQEGGGADAARQRRHVVDGVVDVADAVRRHEPVRRLDADDAAERGGDPAAPTLVDSEREVDRARPDGRAGPARRPAGRARRIDRVAGRPDRAHHPGRAAAELVHVQRPDDRPARVEDPLDDDRVLRRRPGREERALGHRHAADRDVVLHGDGPAGQRAVPGALDAAAADEGVVRIVARRGPATRVAPSRPALEPDRLALLGRRGCLDERGDDAEQLRPFPLAEVEAVQLGHRLQLGEARRVDPPPLAGHGLTPPSGRARGATISSSVSTAPCFSVCPSASTIPGRLLWMRVPSVGRSASRSARRLFSTTGALGPDGAQVEGGLVACDDPRHRVARHRGKADPEVAVAGGEHEVPDGGRAAEQRQAVRRQRPQAGPRARAGGTGREPDVARRVRLARADAPLADAGVQRRPGRACS